MPSMVNGKRSVGSSVYTTMASWPFLVWPTAVPTTDGIAMSSGVCWSCTLAISWTRGFAMSRTFEFGEVFELSGAEVRESSFPQPAHKKHPVAMTAKMRGLRERPGEAIRITNLHPQMSKKDENRSFLGAHELRNSG